MRVVIPLIVMAIAAVLGFQEYANCRLSLPGFAPAPNCSSNATTGGPQVVPPTPQPTPQPIPTPTPLPDPPAPQPVPQPTPQPTAQPDPAPVVVPDPSPVAPPIATPAPPQPSTAPVATGVGYPEASLTAPDVAVEANLRTERKNILEAYTNKNYADAIALADAWLNSRPTDALIALTRSNALAKQLGKPSVVIGLSLPTSGKGVQAGEAVLQGVNMAVQEANRDGGVRNRRVVVEIRNDQNDRALAVQAATSLAGSDALGVIGPVNSSSTIAAADIYNASNLAHIAPTATDDRLAQSGRYTYRLAPPNNAQGTVLARLAKQKGFIRIPVFFDPADAYSKSLADAFSREAESAGISVEPIEFTSGGLPDTSVYSNFADPPVPDAAFISGSFLDVAAIAKSLRDNNINVPLFAGDAAYSQQMLQQGGQAVEGLTLLSFFHSSANVENTNAFVKTFRARYGGGTPNARAAQAYDATRTLLEAVRRATTLDRAGVKTALDGFTTAKPGPGVTSQIVFSKGAIQGRPFVVIEVKGGKLEGVGTAVP